MKKLFLILMLTLSAGLISCGATDELSSDADGQWEGNINITSTSDSTIVPYGSSSVTITISSNGTILTGTSPSGYTIDCAIKPTTTSGYDALAEGTFKKNGISYTSQIMLAKSDSSITGRIYIYRSGTTILAMGDVTIGKTSTSDGDGDDGNNGSGTIPGTPTGVSAGSATSSSLTITWTAVPGATSYNVYRLMTGTVPINYSTYVKKGSSATNSYTDTSLSASTIYSYKVSAVNSAGEGAQSSPASGTTTSSTGGGGTTDNGSLSFTCNGTSYTLDNCTYTYESQYNYTMISGYWGSYVNTDYTFRQVIIVFNSGTTGTFITSASNFTNKVQYQLTTTTSNESSSSIWCADFRDGSSSTTVTSYASSSVQGTFSGTLIRSVGSHTPETLTITNGSFRALPQ